MISVLERAPKTFRRYTLSPRFGQPQKGSLLTPEPIHAALSMRPHQHVLLEALAVLLRSEWLLSLSFGLPGRRQTPLVVIPQKFGLSSRKDVPLDFAALGENMTHRRPNCVDNLKKPAGRGSGHQLHPFCAAILGVPFQCILHTGSLQQQLLCRCSASL